MVELSMAKAKKQGTDPQKESVVPGPPPNAGVVLIVDDDPAVRRTVREMLTTMSFHVLEASHAQDALRIAERHDGPIHLLLTDVVMPGMSGRNIADELLQTRPHIKVLYMSGYSRDILLEQGVTPGRMLLQKPFTQSELQSRVRQILGAPTNDAKS